MRACFVLALLLFPGVAQAAQIVALDVKPTGDVKRGLAETLTPVMLEAVGRVQGLSVISQADVRALLENEADKQALGCTDTACMTEIAGSMGSELLLTSTLGRVGRKWLVNLTMIDVEEAKVVRRSSGESMGSEEMATEAVLASVHNLFREGLPEDLQGPAFLSRRGFEAALRNFARVVLDADADPKPQRKRIVLDLVNTELDYDTKPKLDMLDLAIRRGIGDVKTRSLLSKDRKDMQRHLGAVDQWVVLARDMERVKEIRERARERGVIPSPRPLRFENPEPPDRPSEADMRAYDEASKAARKVAKKAMRAFEKNDVKGFQRYWRDGYESNAERELKSQRQSDKRYGYTYELLPAHATTPELYERGISTMKKDPNNPKAPRKMQIFLRQFKRGEIYDDTRIYLENAGSSWRVTGWW